MFTRRTLILAGIFCAYASTYAQKATSDTIQSIPLEEIEVIATRAKKNTPVAFKNISKEEIATLNSGKDIPFILSTTPSVLTTSDTGTGIGYSSIRIRGTDPSRINVTANGIPMNDAESHEIYWVNTPDLVSSLEDIQVQRGVGTSTNGAGAFGGSINMKTQNASYRRYAEVSGSYGSYNTHKEMVKVGTGLINNHFSFEARLSNIKSDGYRDRASSDLKSYYLQGSYINDKTNIKFVTFGGREITYHAWDGISRDQLKNDRRYNPNGEIKIDGKKAGFYDDQVDNYKQQNYQLLASHYFNEYLKLNWALHHTNGFGFYQEYKNDQSLNQYGIDPFSYEGSLIKKQNLIRKKIVDSRFSGAVTSLTYQKENLDVTFGGAMNYYKNDHSGRVLWIRNFVGNLEPDQEYYFNTGRKTDANFYLKANYRILDQLSFYADAQYRHIRYRLAGASDRWNWSVDPGELQALSFDERFNFFNPKAGLSWDINKHNNVYASFSIAQREPKRGDYTDGLFDKKPTSEKLLDYEVGYELSLKRFNLGVNLYYMDYKDQLVLNGKLNQIGRAISENVPNSYRMGIEISANTLITDWLNWSISGTWSKNRIKDYTTFISDQNYVQHELAWGTTPISFSPSFMGNSMINFTVKGLNISFQSQFTTRQYLDNLGVRENSLDPYLVNHLHLAYKFNVKGLKKLTVGASVYNIFNTKYETNGYAMTSIGTDGKNLSFDPRFYPMAGTNVLVHTTITF